MLAALPLCASEGVLAQTGASVRHHGALIRTPSLDAALGYYGDGLGFPIGDFRPQDGWIRLVGNVPIYLDVEPGGALPPSGVANASITFKVNSVDEAQAALRRAGSTSVSDAPFEVAVGRSIHFTDYAGVSHYALQPNRPGAAFAEPQIYNTGLNLPVAGIAPARALLEQGLGFVPMTERYFPPSIPYLEADQTFGFMLHHHQPGREDYRDRTEAAATDLGVWLVFVTDDLDLATERATAGGARALHRRPQRFAMGRRVAFLTPGGGPFEMWSWR
jgi:predicted enzyme related to lactoylglutathione lyase